MFTTCSSQGSKEQIPPLRTHHRIGNIEIRRLRGPEGSLQIFADRPGSFA
jgi:3-phenylpropionate/cinnamic acid dioxygenase small subunit